MLKLKGCIVKSTVYIFCVIASLIIIISPTYEKNMHEENSQSSKKKFNKNSYFETW